MHRGRRAASRSARPAQHDAQSHRPAVPAVPPAASPSILPRARGSGHQNARSGRRCAVRHQMAQACEHAQNQSDYRPTSSIPFDEIDPSPVHFQCQGGGETMRHTVESSQILRPAIRAAFCADRQYQSQSWRSQPQSTARVRRRQKSALAAPAHLSSRTPAPASLSGHSPH